jgi:hypothetical protein
MPVAIRIGLIFSGSYTPLVTACAKVSGFTCKRPLNGLNLTLIFGAISPAAFIAVAT